MRRTLPLLLFLLLSVPSPGGHAKDSDRDISAKNIGNENLKMGSPLNQWQSDESYSRYIWSLPKAGYSGSGRIAIKSFLPENDSSLEIRLDHGWLSSRGVWASPLTEGAHQIGFLYAGSISGGSSKIIEVAAGPHEVLVGDDLYASPSLRINVGAGETVNLVCGERRRGLKEVWNGICHLRSSQRVAMSRYFLRRE